MHCLWIHWCRQHSHLLLWGAIALRVLDQCQCHRNDSATLRWAGIVQPQVLPTPTGFTALQRSWMSYKSGQLGMLAVKVAVCKAFFSPFIIVFEPRPPAPKAQVSRDMQMLGVTLTHPLVSQCTLSPLPAPSGEEPG